MLVLVALPIRDQLRELLDQQVEIETFDVLAEAPHAHLGHQHVVLLGIAERHGGLPSFNAQTMLW